MDPKRFQPRRAILNITRDWRLEVYDSLDWKLLASYFPFEAGYVGAHHTWGHVYIGWQDQDVLRVWWKYAKAPYKPWGR